MPFSNELTATEMERLAILAEEMGEAIQIIGKILRHGYESRHPDKQNDRTNRRELEFELAHVAEAVRMLCRNRDVNEAGINAFAAEKREKIKPFLHHQPRVT